MLRKYIQEKEEKWDDYLDTCSFAYNTPKFAPFEIMFGREAILPLDLDFGVHQGPCNEAEVTIFSQETEIQQKESQHKALLEEVQKNIFLLRRNRRSCMIRNTVRQCRYTSPEERLQKEKTKRRKTRLPMAWTLFDPKESRKRFL